MTGFGLVAPRYEGSVIDPETGGSAATPERAAELLAIYAKQREAEAAILATDGDFATHREVRLAIYSMGNGYYNVVCEGEGRNGDAVKLVWDMLDRMSMVQVRAEPDVEEDGGRFRVVMRL
jgi:hypothetical protein